MEKKFDKARFKFEQDIVFNPKNEKSYLYLAKIYKIKKNDDQEESNLKTVLLLNPKNEEAILELAYLKIRKSNYSETKKLISDFEKVPSRFWLDESGFAVTLSVVFCNPPSLNLNENP